MKEDIFYCDDEWDNFIKRTKQFPAEAKTGGYFSDQEQTFEDYDWYFPEEYYATNGDCFIQSIAKMKYKRYDISNNQFLEIVAELLQIPINSIPPRPNFNNLTPVDYKNDKWWKDNYYSKVGHYDSGTMERMQRWALGKKENEPVFDKHYTQSINHDDGSLGYADFFNQGEICSDKKNRDMILIKNGWVNAYVYDERLGYDRPHSMIPVKYDTKTGELLCEDIKHQSKKELIRVGVRKLIQCDCTFETPKQ